MLVLQIYWFYYSISEYIHKILFLNCTNRIPNQAHNTGFIIQSIDHLMMSIWRASFSATRMTINYTIKKNSINCLKPGIRIFCQINMLAAYLCVPTYIQLIILQIHINKLCQMIFDVCIHFDRIFSLTAWHREQ